MKMSPFEAELSDVIGAIYNCILEPWSWPATLTRLSQTLSCHAAALSVLDRSPDAATLTGWFISDGVSQDWAQRHTENNYAEDAIPFFDMALARGDFDWDMPIVLSRLVPPEARSQMRVMREWAVPQGFCDVMSIVVLATPERIVTVDLIRHENQGLIGDREIASLRTLAPHLRRSSKIANMLDMQAADVHAYTTTVNSFGTAVFFVDHQKRVLHADHAARSLLDHKHTLENDAGILRALDADTQGSLERALQTAIADQQGTAFRLARLNRVGTSALGYVLPLTNGARSPNIATAAGAAIFVTNIDTADAVLTLVSLAYGLSRAEARLLTRLVNGQSMIEAAAGLNIEISTARTHLARLFTKTGTRRQGELIALISRIKLPVRTSQL